MIFYKENNMKKKVERKNVLVFCLIMLIAGFFVGQFIHIPAFDDYNLLDAMQRPGGNSHRR